ncbi:MAG: YbaN family protein [Acidobacteria bacterium]|nr:YbaN family protein [Acidobacteriota bacterium]
MRRVKLSPWKSRFYITAGFICVGLGLIGIPTPLLPTTPFLLLAAFCFARGSQRWHDWLVEHHIFGSYILAFREKRGLTRGQKLNIALGSSLTLMITGYFAPLLIGKVLAGFIWLTGMIALYFYRSAPTPAKSQTETDIRPASAPSDLP